MKVQIISLKSKYILNRYISKYQFALNDLNFDCLAAEVRDLNESEKNSLTDSARKNNLSYYCYLNNILFLSELTSLHKLLSSNKNIVSIIDKYTNYNRLNDTYGVLNQERVSVMGILNVTPDSFSDGGKFIGAEKAIKHAEEMIKQGADIIDIGGESSRPGAESVSEEEELNRVIPVIKQIHLLYPHVKISIDTTKSKVAYEALANGAALVNDISSYTADKKILDVVKEFNVPYVLMHMKGTPRNMQQNPFYEDVVNEVYEYLLEKTEFAYNRGVQKLIVDPGIGFGKRTSDNYELLNRLEEFKGLGFPILTGLSRKSFLGKALNLAVTEREEATLSAETAAVLNGAKIIRTHNVKNALIARDLLYYIYNPEKLDNV